MFNQIIININNIIKNIELAKKKPQLTCVMMKANAYGVGASIVAREISPSVDYFGVANIEEARELKLLTDKKILIVGPLCEYGDLDFEYTCSSLDDINKLKSTNQKYKIHLKVNTGMNRYGFSSLEEFYNALKEIKNSQLKLVGVYTHFATTDSFVNEQMKKFLRFKKLSKKKFKGLIFHADNSTVANKFNHKLDMVRLGHSIYLNSKYPSLEIQSQIVETREIKVGQLVGYSKRFIAKRDMKIAILPIGYADGFSLKLIGFKIKIGKHYCRVLNVCMDCCMIDITDTRLKKLDYVGIVDSHNPISKYAKYLKTIDYEVLTSLSHVRGERTLSPSTH